VRTSNTEFAEEGPLPLVGIDRVCGLEQEMRLPTDSAAARRVNNRKVMMRSVSSGYFYRWFVIRALQGLLAARGGGVPRSGRLKCRLAPATLARPGDISQQPATVLRNLICRSVPPLASQQDKNRHCVLWCQLTRTCSSEPGTVPRYGHAAASIRLEIPWQCGFSSSL
jgi:hypothetical protein